MARQYVLFFAFSIPVCISWRDLFFLPPLSWSQICLSESILWQVIACVLFLLYSRAAMLDFSFDLSEERPLEAFEDIFASYESKK